jgi:GTPase SAR1 family protein
MKLQKGNFYTNFDVPQFPSRTDRRIRALLYGNCGVGKTCFLNKMCNTRHSQKVYKGSLTKDLIY